MRNIYVWAPYGNYYRVRHRDLMDAAFVTEAVDPNYLFSLVYDLVPSFRNINFKISRETRRMSFFVPNDDIDNCLIRFHKADKGIIPAGLCGLFGYNPHLLVSHGPFYVQVLDLTADPRIGGPSIPEFERSVARRRSRSQ